MQHIAKYVILVVSVAAVLITFGNSYYDGHLWTGSSTYIIDLDRSPLWSPPPSPDYAAFKSTFDDLPSSKPAEFTITRVHKWSWTLLDLALLFLLIGLISALVYFPLRKRLHDPVLHYAGWIGMGLAGSAILCFVLWVLVGGWGPPVPLLFTVLGVVSGAVVAAITWRSESPNPIKQLFFCNSSSMNGRVMWLPC